MESDTLPLPRTWRWTEHLGTWLTLACLALIAVGMFHSALADGTVMEGAANRPLMLVGSTSRYVFLFRTDAWRTEIVPVENVPRMVTLGSLPPRSRERRERVHRRLDSLSIRDAAVDGA